MTNRDRKWWGNLDDWSPEFAAAAIERFDAHQKHLKASKRHDRIKRMWSTVYMRDRDGNCDNTEISSGGRRGETLFITPNRLGRLVRDHVTMVTQTKSMPEPMAANSDAESQDAVQLARGIIEHYKREADLEGIKAERAFVSEICGDSYLHVQWDTELGEPVAVEDSEPAPDAEPTQRVLYEGDFRFSVRTPYDVAYERSSNERKRPRWWVIMEPVNRYDLLAQIESEVKDEEQRKRLEHAVMAAPCWSDRIKELEFEENRDEFDDCIPMFFVYIEECRARAQGRYAKVIDKRTVWFDSPLAEPRAPVFRLSQGEVLFRNEPTTPNHDGLPLADALTAQMSTILSNHANYGMQRMMSARAANLSHTEIDTGASVINYDHVGEDGQPIPEPKPWAMGPGNPELMTGFQMFAHELDLVAAGSPVTRGDPGATQGDSGSKVAALFAAAQNVASWFIAAVLRSEEELYTYLVDSLKRHATTKRVVGIVGENNTFQAREYTGDKLSKVQRVSVKQADAMRDTLQGKLAMVELLDGKTPQQQRQIVATMRTGNPDIIADETEPARILLERENQDLRNPERPLPVMMPNDPHADHWRSHMNQLNSPDARRDPAIFQRIIKHAKEHEAALDPMSPMFAGHPALLLTGQKPLPAMQMSGAPPKPPQMNPDVREEGDKPDVPKDTNGPVMPNAPRMPVDPISGDRMSPGGAGQPSRPQPSPAMG